MENTPFLDLKFQVINRVLTKNVGNKFKLLILLIKCKRDQLEEGFN